MRKSDRGPCLACGDYDGSHDPGCVLDPADRPHGYKPRKITADRNPAYSTVAHDLRKKRGAFAGRSNPCDVCGGSATLVVHDVSPAWPRKFPSRWSDDHVWMMTFPPLAM